MTERIQESFSFIAQFSRRVQAEFTAGRVSSDGGALLLRESDRRINLLGRLSGCFLDSRRPLLVKHRLSEMLSQRIHGMVLGRLELMPGLRRKWIRSASSCSRSAPSYGSACAACCSNSAPPTHGKTSTPTPSTLCDAELHSHPTDDSNSSLAELIDRRSYARNTRLTKP